MILLVEDDDVVRQLTEHVLNDAGYTVLSAIDGDSAVHTFEQHSDKIHLLLTDVAMPGKINGLKLAELLTQKYSELKVLFISGELSDEDIQDHITQINHCFLSKPFTPRILAKTVRNILNG